jgi:hypothetical protein
MKKETVFYPIPLLTVLGVTFVILKLFGAICWPWIWVLAPFWIQFIEVLVILFILSIFMWFAKE